MRIVNTTGVLGEDLAAKYLKKIGYKILERNYRKKYEEVDIIALDGKTLVFIEVKTRRSDSYGNPFEAVSSYKLQHLVKSAQAYKISHEKLPDDMRIDVIGVTVKGDKINIDHLKNVTG